MAFTFDKDSGYGGFSIDNEGAFDLPGLFGSGALSPGGVNQYVDVSYRDYGGDNTISSLSKVFDALDKARTYSETAYVYQ